MNVDMLQYTTDSIQCVDVSISSGESMYFILKKDFIGIWLQNIINHEKINLAFTKNKSH